MKPTKESLASRLNGREYGEEITSEEESDAMAAGLVVVFGASDDLTEFRGALNEEMSANDGATHFLHRDGILEDVDQIDCDKCLERVKQEQKKCAKVEAQWCPKTPDCSWLITTALPHATFDIKEDENLYCRGIVFDVSDLPRL